MTLSVINADIGCPVLSADWVGFVGFGTYITAFHARSIRQPSNPLFTVD